MKKWAVLISAVGLAFSVSGCSSDYVMATKDGRMILTDGKPAVDDDTCRDFLYALVHGILFLDLYYLVYPAVKEVSQCCLVD